MHALFAALHGPASLDEPVLLCGEVASGRETLARAMHELTRPSTPFLVLDLASIPLSLVETVLFGSERRSFTGAHAIQRGPFEEVEGGTVVLRELGAIPWGLQPKLLRLLEQRQFRRVGGSALRPFHGRVIATTHADLDQLVTSNALRGDLRAQFARHQFTVPPLRDRLADLPSLLVDHPLDADQRARVSSLPWRGNFAEWKAFVAELVRDPVSAITERELLAAIEDAPADDGPRLVYADALTARGDVRGELIQLQLAARPDDHKIRAAERRLLEDHGKRFAASVIAAATTPVHAAEVTFERGFVAAVSVDGEALRKFGEIARVAPLLTRVVTRGFLEHASWSSPALRQLRALEVTIQTLGELAIDAISRSSYLTGLRSLALTAGATTLPDDVELRRLGVRSLAASANLAGVTHLSLRGYPLDAHNLASLLADRAKWTLTELDLLDCDLSSLEVRAVVTAPKAQHLTTLRVSRLDHESRELLAGSHVLTGATIFVDGQVLR